MAPEISLENKRVLVTGGNGFLGSFVLPRLESEGARVIAPHSREYDLREKSDVSKMFEKLKPEVVIHMAVDAGGIGYMKQHPASTLYNNIMMNTLVMEHSIRTGIEKFVGIGTVCSYPKVTDVPFKEDDLWKGYPEETNAPYGLAKKMMLVHSQGARAQYGINAIHLLLVNLYGPRDDFDLESSHVIPALIRKFDDAVRNKKDCVEIWGTGSASREFLYAVDAAEGIVLATKKYNKPEPVNLGSGMEISVKDLAMKIVEITGFKGSLKFDYTKPDGQPRRCLDTSRAFNEFGFKARTDFETGLKNTIKWYQSQNQ